MSFPFLSRLLQGRLFCVLFEKIAGRSGVGQGKRQNIMTKISEIEKPGMSDMPGTVSGSCGDFQSWTGRIPYPTERAYALGR